MDDVAKEASMSKKTLYQYFQNKDSLVTEVVQKHFELERAEFEGIKAEEVADLVVQGIKSNQLYLFPHAEMKAAAEERMSQVVGAFGEADPERVAAQEQFLSQLLDTGGDA